MRHARRDKMGLFCEIFLPLALVILGLGVSKIKFITNMPKLLMEGAVYPENNNIIFGHSFNSLYQ